MPILKNAKKALRVSKKKTIVNKRIKSKSKTAIDVFKKSPTLETLSSAFSAIDRSVKKNMIHKNRAARMKSGLSKLVASEEKKVIKKAVKKAK